MLDVDGVVVRDPGGGAWTDALQADLGVDPEELDRRFFRVHFGDVLAGRADLFDRLDLVLPSLGSVRSTELVDYWFTHDATLDERLLTDLARARDRGIMAHLATIQEHHRAQFLWRSVGLCERFAAMHYSAEMGAFKLEPAFYRIIESRTGLAPAEHCLIDDRAENVNAAQDAGWQAVQWTAGRRLAEVLRELST